MFFFCFFFKLQFFSIANTHFFKACLVSSKLLTQIPKPLTQNAKPFIYPAKSNFAFKTVLCHLKRVLCFLMTNTAHYMSRHSKHRLNTDVLNGKHYYEMGKHQ